MAQKRWLVVEPEFIILKCQILYLLIMFSSRRAKGLTGGNRCSEWNQWLWDVTEDNNMASLALWTSREAEGHDRLRPTWSTAGDHTCRTDVGPKSTTSVHHQSTIGSMPHVDWCTSHPSQMSTYTDGDLVVGPHLCFRWARAFDLGSALPKQKHVFFSAQHAHWIVPDFWEKTVNFGR